MAERVPASLGAQRPACRWAQATHIGKVRAENQDACLADSRIGLFAVSDGMGGHQGGATAARIVVECLPRELEASLRSCRASTSGQIVQGLALAVEAVNRRVFEASERDSKLEGMGATLVLALWRAPRVYVAHVGDSRAYLLRDGALSQLTEDHSVATLLVKRGVIAAEEARRHRSRHHLARCIGMPGPAEPDVHALELRPGDRLLLCSDGLTGMVDDAQIAGVLTRQLDPDEACQALVRAANDAGGHDNVSVVVVLWIDSRG